MTRALYKPRPTSAFIGATMFERSKALWIGGAIVGGVVGGFAGNSFGKALLGAALGSILLGAVGDVVLEQEQQTGVLSLLPLKR